MIRAENDITLVRVDDGADGKTSYFHIKYSAVASPTSSSEMSETPLAYIGTYVDFTEADSTDPTKYTWSRFEGIQGKKGEQGIPGIGQDGKTSYLHIAYATSADGSEGFSVTESANKTYIGQYTDFVSTDSTDYTKYSWTKIKGETGAEGYSPTVSTGTSSDGSTTVTVTNKDGSNTTTLVDGKARTDINNLEIGGRNLLTNPVYFLADGVVSNGITFNRTSNPSAWKIKGTATSTVNVSLIGFTNTSTPTDSTTLLKEGQTYTASIKIEGSWADGAYIDVGISNSSGSWLSAFKLYPNTAKSNTFTATAEQYALRYWTVLIPSGESVDCTVYCKFEIGDKATDWTPAPEDVDAGIKDAAKVATNFINYDSTNGLIIGNKTSGSWSGYRSQILPDSFNILDESSNVLASYGDAKIELGKNAVSSIIEMCGGMARVSARYGGLTTIYSNNGGYQTTLDYDFNETTFKSKVGSNYGSYEFIYSGGVWECSYSGNNAGYVQVNLSDYGITLKTISINEYAGITINYWNGSEATFINADTTKPSRKLILGLAESGTADNPDYANIEIERSKEGSVEHSKINLLTVHDGANVAGVSLDNGNIELDVSGEILINGIPLNDYVVEQGTSGDWKYRKWNSGIAECFGYISLGSISVSAAGNLYRGNTSVSLPSIFNDIPSNVHITNGDPLVHIISINGRATDASTLSVYVWKATKSAADSVYASFYVIGTWK